MLGKALVFWEEILVWTAAFPGCQKGDISRVAWLVALPFETKQ